MSGSLESRPGLRVVCASLEDRWSSILEECHCGQVPSALQHSMPHGKTENTLTAAKPSQKFDKRTSFENGSVQIREYGLSTHSEDILTRPAVAKSDGNFKVAGGEVQIDGKINTINYYNNLCGPNECGANLLQKRCCAFTNRGATLNDNRNKSFSLV